MTLQLSAPQNIFLNGLNTKFRAYVGGLGCIHPETKIWTEHGLMRICEITKPTRVLSWSEKNQRFELCLSGGAFPKGKANLYRVSAEQGEFVSTERHRFFSSDHKYLCTAEIDEHVKASVVSSGLLQTISEFGLKWLPSDVEHSSQKVSDLMASYAIAARQHGQQFLKDQESAQCDFQEQACAQTLPHNCDPCVCGHKGGLKGQKLKHTHPDQLSAQNCKKGYSLQFLEIALNAVRRTSSLLAVRIFDYRQLFEQFQKKFAHHYKKVKSFVLAPIQSFLQPLSNPIVESSLLKVSVAELNHVYYDMQVLNTNNYVDEYGFIHHNSGKTFVGCLDLLIFAAKNPKTKQGYFAPTIPMVRDIFYPTLAEACELMGFQMKITKNEKLIALFRNGYPYGHIQCVSMHDPYAIVGFKISRALVDEIDILKKEKAKLAWDKILGRLRLKVDGEMNTIGVTTTPEGFNFIYETFAKDPTESYSMVQASTYENLEHLPADYIESLLETYTKEVALAYVRGEFVNMKSGTVYSKYDKIKNNSTETIQPNETLFIGMDFNVTNMSAIVHVKRDGNPHAVEEITKGYDTPEVILSIKSRYPNHKIRIYPDASGTGRHSIDATKNDIALLENAGFTVIADESNPRIRDRVLAMNVLFCNNKGIRRYFVNKDKCPTYSDNLSQQIWGEDGKPDKKKGNDHTNDAGGYFINQDYPIIQPVRDLKVHFKR